MAIDFTKPIQTKNGQEVDITTLSAEGAYVVRGHIRHLPNPKRSWTKDGYFVSSDYPNVLDLINVHEPQLKPEPASNQMKIDITKPVKTRDGRAVEIISDKGRADDFPLLGYIEDSKTAAIWRTDGAWAINGKPHPNDLVQTQERWINVYEVPPFCESRKEADARAYIGRIACIKVAYTPGQFDN